MYRLFIAILFCFALQPAFAQRATDTFKLYFDLGVPTMNRAMEKKIDLLIYNDKIVSGASVMIIGYADFLGTEGYNKSLSMLRAKNVKEYLVKYGLNAADIKVCEGKGEITRRGLTTKEGYPTDRRVDIVVNNKIKGKATPPLHPPKTLPKPPAPLTGSKAVVGSIDEIKDLKPGSTFLLKNVYFPAGRHVIKPESQETLERLYTVLKNNPTLRINIEGHVCCIEDEPDATDIDTYEPTLSVNRAKAIYNFLVGKGIDASRLHYEGFGRRRPVIMNEQTEEDAEKNRRVEIRILSK